MTAPPPCTAPENDYREVEAREPAGIPTIGVVVPAYNRAALLDRTLAGLTVQSVGAGRFQVVVADDGSTEDIGAIVDTYRHALAIGLVRQERDEFGAARARNLGAQGLGTDVLIFLDADCIPDRDLVAHHAWWHARASNLVVVGTRRGIDSSGFEPVDIAAGDADLAAAAGEPDERGRFVPDDWRQLFYRRTRRLLVGDSAFRTGLSSNLSVRRERFDAAGGFSKDFRAWGGEDTELSWRLWNDGAFFVPDDTAVAYHQIQDDPPDRAAVRREARRRAHPFVADRIPHRFYRKTPSHLAAVPKVTWMVRVETPAEAELAWRECSRATFADTDLVLCGPPSSVEHLGTLADSNDRVRIVVDDVPQAFDESLRAARGEYVALLDARARIDRTMLARAVERLERDSRAVAVRFAYRFSGGDRYLRLDDLLDIDESVGRHGLPLFAVARRRELMKDWSLLAQPHAAWRATLGRSDRIELIVSTSVAIDEAAARKPRLPWLREATAAGVQELARSAVKQARAMRGGGAVTSEAIPDERIPVEYVGLTGKNNLGDDAVLAAIRRLMPWAAIGTNQPDPRLLLVGGGTLLNGERYYLNRMLRHDAPTLERALFGPGVRNPQYWGVTEPMEDWFSFIDSALVAGVRGPDSVANLRALGYWRDVSVLGDPALSLVPPPGVERVEGRVVICPLYADGNLLGRDDAAVLSAVSTTVRRLRKEGREVVMLSAFPEDDRWIMGLMREADAPEMPYVAGYADLDATMGLLASADLVIGERLHAVILAAATDTPFVALEYRPKVRDFMRSVGREDAMIRTDEMARLDEVVDLVIAEAPSHVPATAAKVAEFRRLQAGAADSLRTALVTD